MKSKRLAGILLLLFVFTVILSGCGGVKSKTFTKENTQQVLDEIKSSKDLTGEEYGLLTAALMRNAMQKDKNILEGKTVGQVIEDQRKLKIEADAREAEQKRLAEEARKKEEALAAELAQYLVVTITKKDFQPKNIYAGDYDDHILIGFAFKNTGTKNIKAFRGVTRFMDVFGEEIYKVNLSRDEGIKAGETVTWIGSIKYNQFMDDHKKFKDTEFKNIKFDWKANAIIFEDGTTLGNTKPAAQS